MPEKTMRLPGMPAAQRAPEFALRNHVGARAEPRQGRSTARLELAFTE